MKKLWLILIIAVCFLLPLVVIICLTLIFKWSLWIILGLFIFEFIVGLIVGVVYLIKSLTSIKTKKPVMDEKTARKLVVKAFKEDEDDPDNFMIKEFKPMNIGERGTEKTPIIVYIGKGTELDNDLVGIINLNTKKIAKLKNPNKLDIISQINSIADHPVEEKEIIETKTGLDAFGRPTTTTISKKMTQEEKKKEEDKKVLDETNAM